MHAIRTLCTGLAAGLAAAPAEALVTFDDPSQYEVFPGLGIASLITTFESGQRSQCSGALIDGAVVTAGHCFLGNNSPTRGAPVSTTISFDGSVTGIEVDAADIEVSEDWTGDATTSPADIAVVRLPDDASPGVAPFALPTFTLNPDFFPVGVHVAGYGLAGQGVVDPSLGPGFGNPRTLRIGFNHYDRPPFGSDPYWGAWLLYDFDNFTAGKNVIGEPGWITLPNGAQAITELDWDRDGSAVYGESMIALGDSGGPSYLDNILVGIHSWVSPSPDFGAIGGDSIYTVADGAEDVTFGWVGADVQVARYTDWIRAAAAGPIAQPAVVPVPPAAALLITGLALLGANRRRGQ